MLDWCFIINYQQLVGSKGASEEMKKSCTADGEKYIFFFYFECLYIGTTQMSHPESQVGAAWTMSHLDSGWSAAKR